MRILKARRGTNEVFAEFVLIVVSIISSVILGGFLFGTLAVAGTPAEVDAQASSCSAINGSQVCRVTLTNVGARNAATDGVCTLTIAGQARPGSIADGGVIPASGSLSNVSCMVEGPAASSGTSVVGTVSLTNGVEVPFVAAVS
jgi:hypothetical protein